MAHIDIGDAATAGVKLATRQPLAVLTWGLMSAGFVALLLILFGGAIVGAVQGMIQAGPNPSDSVVAQRVLGFVGALFGLIFLLALGLWVIKCVIMGAVIRAELEPHAGGFAYLRFGRQELWLMAVTFVQGLVIAGFQFVISIPVAIFQQVMLLGAAMGSRGGDNASTAAAVLPVLGIAMVFQVGIIAATLWLWLRLSMGPILSFRDREFRLFESWAMTKGHAWRMFLSMLVVGLILMVLYIVIEIMVVAVGFGTILGSPDLKEPAKFFARPPQEWMGVFGPLLFLLFVAGVVVTGVGNTLVWSSVARMYKQLNPDSDLGATFA